MAFPDSNINVNNQGGTVTTGNGSNSVGSASGTTKPTIQDLFNMKRADVGNKYGQAGLDLFDKANTDGVDGISQEEIDKYNSQQNGEAIKSKSGKRSIQGGVYTVVSGDTLSKIANDFGVNLIELYNINKSVVGKNMNKIEVGMQLKIPGAGATTDTQTSTANSTQNNANNNEDLAQIIKSYMKQQKSEKPKIFAGMTREQAAKRGDETLALFEQYAGAGAEKLEGKQFIEYKKTLSTKSPTDIMNELPAALGKNGKKMTTKEMGTVLGDLVEEGAKATGIGKTEAGRKTSEKIQDMIVVADNYGGKIPQKEDIAQNATKLMKDIKASAKEEIENKGDLYQTHYKRLKEGKFTEFELASGIQEGDELTEEQITRLTELAVKAEHIYPVLKTLAQSMQAQNADGAKDNTIMLLIMDLGDQFFDNPDVLAVAQMTGLMSVVSQAKQQFAANHIAENSSLSIENMNQEVAAMYVGTLADKSDAESFQKFAENHAESIDFINQVVEKVIQITDDPGKAESLRQAMNNAMSNVQNDGVTSGSPTRGAPDRGTVSTNTYNTQSSETNTNYVSVPTFDTQESRKVNDLKKAATEYQLQNQKPEEKQKELSYDEYKSLTQATALRVLKRLDPVTQATIIKNIVADNKGNSKEMVTIYDDTDCFALMTAIKNNFIQKGQGLQLDLLTNGNQLVQKFLIKEGVITNEDLAHLSNEDRSKLEEDGILSA